MPYFDHASTSLPKDPRVIEAVTRMMTEAGATPGRGGHRAAQQAQQVIEEARERGARLLGVPDAERITFTLNATDALNLALRGTLQPGDEVVTTQIEHNSVLRPLRGMQGRRGLRIKLAAADGNGVVAADEILQQVSPRTRLLVMSHASNVTGAMQPVVEVGRELRQRFPRCLLLVDVAQTAGHRDLTDVASVASMLAAAGHKGPGGPLGTGMLWSAAGLTLQPLREGGTGRDSELLRQPTDFPGALEAGSPNLPGIAGLNEAMRIALDGGGLAEIARKRQDICAKFLDAAGTIEGIRIFGPQEAAQREPVFPLLIDGLSVAEAETILDLHFDLQVRAGLHCAPGTHQALGTRPDGTLRFSLSHHTSAGDLQLCMEALRQCATGSS